MTALTSIPHIYVVCLAAYTHGKWHGVSIDALNNNPDQIMAEVQAMLRCSPVPDAEAWDIRDDEGFEGVAISGCSNFEQVHKLAKFIHTHGVLGAKLLDHCDNDLEVAQAIMEDGYQGCYASLADFAEELTTDTTTIPENLRHDIDYARMAQEMELSSEIFTIRTTGEKVHVFWNR